MMGMDVSFSDFVDDDVPGLCVQCTSGDDCNSPNLDDILGGAPHCGLSTADLLPPHDDISRCDIVSSSTTWPLLLMLMGHLLLPVRAGR